jgi:hypothetical protein
MKKYLRQLSKGMGANLDSQMKRKKKIAWEDRRVR